ncbi:MAG: hypothetical protein A2Z43_05795 [Syntrophobacterales bacterium RBG_19FT_COMBO_59_10]|nr:MAG: hypothetical protein A2Z43_05795 [Syntrophobacterales bacterium RBG_19FT_COMBO_59_10]
MPQIGANIQRKPVHRHPMSDRDALGADFCRSCPYPGIVLFAAGHNTERFQGANQRFLHPAGIPMDVATKSIEIQDWITNQLPRSVIGDIPPPIGLIYLDPFLIQKLLANQDVVEPPPPSDGKARVMFQENDGIRQGSVSAGLIKLLL